VSGPDEVLVDAASWQDDRAALEYVRRRVFIEEQGVSEEEEWDDADRVCHHVIARTAKRDAVGTGRLDPSGRLGRVAVLREFRGRGVGSRIVAALIEEARRRGLRRLCLNSQVQAVPLYARFGFRAVGDVFLEAGIEHKRMELEL
jgi:predicted GNAT family N-acyltransferase